MLCFYMPASFYESVRNAPGLFCQGCSRSVPVAEIEQLVLELRQAGAHALGAAEAETDSGAGSAGTALAGGEHHGRDAAAGRLGGAAPQAAANRALHPTAGARRGTQPGVVRGLQGLVSHR